MKTRLIAIVTMVFAVCPGASLAVNGSLRSTDKGQRVLHVWGTDYEMGYAHGFLLGQEVVDVMGVYGLPGPMYTVQEFNDERDFIFDTFDIDPELEDEAQGLYDGLVDAGADLHVPSLGRDLNADDIVAFTALRELAGLQCATWAAWGDATVADAEIDGQMVVAHNSDFTLVGDETTLHYAGTHGLVIAYEPSDPDRQRYVSIVFPGFLGVMAGLNESGVGMFVNRGSIVIPRANMNLDPGVVLGIYQTRKALAARDGNDDGVNDIVDIHDHFAGVREYAPAIIQAFGPAARTNPPSAVLEINNLVRASRLPADDPNFAPNMQLSLNWEDKLVPVRQTFHQIRYVFDEKLINETYGHAASIANMWDFLDRNAGVPQLNVTFYSMIFLPEQLRVGLSLWSDFDNDPATNNVWYDFEELFAEADDDTDDDASDDDADDDSDDDAFDDDAQDDDQADDDGAVDDDASDDDAKDDASADDDATQAVDTTGESNEDDDASCGC
ncbi:MAG: hypothetical protein KJ042_09255 [Deltaproteobacteria bacterium]|nr:hypothetical protein [Deltaproteobacteria bacterium]